MQIISYNRSGAVEYAHKWAFSRNPDYFDFHGIGGDCTNFISQCIHAGGAVMNYTPVFGWFYKSTGNRTPSWTGVEYFYRFVTENQGIGPFAEETTIDEILEGDVVQLSFDGILYAHSLIVTSSGSYPSPEYILTATHTYDSDNRPLETYSYEKARFIHIQGIRK